jgi:hypothetical protein
LLTKSEVVGHRRSNPNNKLQSISQHVKIQKNGTPIAYWTGSGLRHYLIEQKVFEETSSRWINELLRRADIRPHKNKYWLTTKDKTDPLY